MLLTQSPLWENYLFDGDTPQVFYKNDILENDSGKYKLLLN